MSHSPPALSPFAPKSYASPPSIDGVRIATAQAGIKYENRTDLLLAVFEPGTRAGGVLTRSKTRSAAVDWCAEQLKHGRARALVVNSGNANAFTGQRGIDAVKATAEAAAAAVGCQPEEVFVASTGVIGEPLDVSSFGHLLRDMAHRAAPGSWLDAARAIVTTDTYPKLTGSDLAIDDGTAHLAAIAKGSGMIAPDMATMLSFAFTDLSVAQHLLQQAIHDAADLSFNCITVDGDTSTSDTALIFATGAAEARGLAEIADPGDARHQAFRLGLDAAMRDMAQAIVRDGEGLTKHVTIEVTGAETDTAARAIAMSIANSPLIKTAVAGEDPNWGRVVMAVGKAGERADRDRLDISFGPHRMATAGERAADHDEVAAAAYMKNAEIEISVDVGIGHGRATVWTCDLTHGYISINADYRT